MKDLFGYKGKRVVVTGASSGMGQAVARLLVDLGAEVYALGRNKVTVPVKQHIKMDLLQKKSIDAAVKQLPDNLYALFNCAGIAAPPFSALDCTLANFVGHRHLTESLLPKINDGGAIAFISSGAGYGWRKDYDTIKPLLDTCSFDEGRAWLEANEDVNTGYTFSKLCICAYVKLRAAELAKRCIRINSILPAPTETGMFPQFVGDTVVIQGRVAQEFSSKEGQEVLLAFTNMCRDLCGRYATAEEMAEPVVFLNSKMSRYISGENMMVDFGYIASVETGQSPNFMGI